VLQSAPNREPLGIFRAISTHDGEALARDGQGFYAFNRLDTRGAQPIVEILFGDGFWMLAATTDLEIQTPRS
jgi:hypothetical protein